MTRKKSPDEQFWVEGSEFWVQCFGFRVWRYAQDCQCILRKDANFVPSRNSDARSVMLRIPLPEYADGTLYIIQDTSFRVDCINPHTRLDTLR